eukprot:1492522-Alexandrium_andersonii.AAC.1
MGPRGQLALGPVRRARLPAGASSLQAEAVAAALAVEVLWHLDSPDRRARVAGDVLAVARCVSGQQAFRAHRAR